MANPSKLVDFYKQCIDNGYTDMNDETQSLKAKVIASDLGLDYKNISKLFESAELAFKKESKRQERLAINGEFLFELKVISQDINVIRIYKRPDKSVYYTIDNSTKKNEDISFSVESRGTVYYSYKPSKMVYTGATVGGVSTGGWTTVGGECVANLDTSGNKGVVVSVCQNKNITIESVVLSASVCNIFKRHTFKINNVRDKKIECMKTDIKSVEEQKVYYNVAKSNARDSTLANNLLLRAADVVRLSLRDCNKIADFLNQIIYDEYPPSDDEIYDEAIALLDYEDSYSLNKALNLFNIIYDYKDSSEQIEYLKEQIEIVRQEEKERKIINEEIKQKKLKKVFIIITSIICICFLLIFGVVLKFVFIPSVKYHSAVKMMTNGEYTESIEKFKSLSDYKDCEDKINECNYLYATDLFSKKDYSNSIKYFKQCFGYKDSNKKSKNVELEFAKKAKVGDKVYFGSYEQDNNISNGKEVIEWRVLAKENNRILVIGYKALDCQPFNETREDVTWRTCTLRKWLNSDFLNSAFTNAEKTHIPMATVSANKNPMYNTSYKKITKDRLFLLSVSEINKYFKNDYSRKCIPTTYAKANGVLVTSYILKNGIGTCWWWLRSPGESLDIAVSVALNGSATGESREYVDAATNGVRPAMWINLN